MLGVIREINERASLGVDAAAIDDPLVQKIVSHLTEFATHGRYHNLNVATRTASGVEPLAGWAREVGGEILRRHYRPSAALGGELAVAERLDASGGVFVSHVGDDGKPIRDFRTLVTEGAVIETKQRYSVFYLHRLAMFGIEVLDALDVRCGPLFATEAFRHFFVDDRRAILRRKRWDV